MIKNRVPVDTDSALLSSKNNLSIVSGMTEKSIENGIMNTIAISNAIPEPCNTRLIFPAPRF